MAELIRCVGQHRVVVETVFTEREALHPFHGKEWSEKLRNPPIWHANVIGIRHRCHRGTLLEIQRWEVSSYLDGGWSRGVLEV
jgi:hypothetical protein